MIVGWSIWTRTLGGSRRSLICCRRLGSWTKFGNSDKGKNGGEKDLTQRGAETQRAQRRELRDCDEIMFDRENADMLAKGAAKLEEGFAALPEFATRVPGAERIGEVLSLTAERLRNNYPYFHPLYAGQMLKPPHPVARLAYVLAMWINPNNHALDGGRASSAMEKEAVAELAAMFGWQIHLGHLCGGGTMANLEALWVAGQLQPNKKILASEQAHYTHHRISSVLQLEFEPVPVDLRARMDSDALRKRVARGDVGTVVATMGTTATGSVDALPEILAL